MEIVSKELTRMAEERKVSPLFKVVKWLIWLFYPKITVEGAENIPNEPCIIVGNHTQMHGPIACELYSPCKRYTWCAAEMMKMKDVPAYAFQDFWSQKPKYTHWFFKILSYLIAPLAALIFGNAETIAVHHDVRIMSTYRETLKRMQEGASIVLFPEKDEHYNHILYEFQTGFVDLAKLYYRKAGKAVAFVPLYIAPRLKKMYYGKPVYYNPDADLNDERTRICEYLKHAITDMAESLPRHIVIPYRNIPKKLYPTNIPEVNSHENARR